MYSDADDWFEELPQEEKKDWVAIELSFHKRWLKEEVLSIKETVTIENEPQVLPTLTKSLKNRYSHYTIPPTPLHCYP